MPSQTHTYLPHPVSCPVIHYTSAAHNEEADDIPTSSDNISAGYPLLFLSEDQKENTGPD